MNVTDCIHYSLDLEPDDQGWFTAKCNCGWEAVGYPTAEDTCDALMQHAFEAGLVASPASGGTTGDRDE